MSGPGTAARAALAQPIIRPVFIAFLDILGDPIRVTTAPYGLDFTGSSYGLVDLDGHIFSAADDTKLISVSEVEQKEGGSGTVTATLSGLAGIDDDLMTTLGAKANYQGRVARIWVAMFSEELMQIGAPWLHHAGYMMVPQIVGDSTQQTIVMQIESYLSFLSQATGRTYLSQSDYDAGDLSAKMSIAVANGTSTLAPAAAAGGRTGVDILGGLFG